MIIELTIALGVTVGCGLAALALHPLDKHDDDLPALGESIDRAIALAAALPDDFSATRVYLTPQGAELAAAL